MSNGAVAGVSGNFVRCCSVALVCLAMVFTWQFLVVKYNYAGNWTGLYCTGDRFQPPPALASEHIWLFKNSYGYDGQAYHYIAHDPWILRGFDRYIDAPRIRYRRILIPALAYLIAGGHDRYIDAAYLGVVLLFVFLGSFWLSRYAALHGWTPWMGLGFLVIPSVLVSIDRLTVDLQLAALCIGFVLFVETNPGWPLYLVLVSATLVRDSGFLLLAGYVGALLLERRFRRAAIFCTAALPALGWYGFVSLHTAPYYVRWFMALPFGSYVRRILHPLPYPFAWPVALSATLLDYLALAGIAVAVVLALRMLFQKNLSPIAISIYGFTVLATFFGLDDIWSEAYGFGRILTPLVLLLALTSFPTRRIGAAVPLFMITPRIALQCGPFAYHIVIGILGRSG